MKFAVAIVFSSLLALSLGCGRDTKDKIVQVEGKIHFANGKPLPAGTLLLFNPSEGGAGAATGATAADGTFKLVHATGRDGAELGKYAVILRAPRDNEADFYRIVPKDYYDAGVLSAEVAEGMSPLDFSVALPRGRVR